MGVQRVGLDEDAVEIELAQQLSQDPALVVVAGGVAGLGDRQAQRC